ncbi:ATP-binding protein [Mycobacterium asiaticum]|uniref:ATP-binding protein n=1 Tax=Mycobacterium asiaticum TaxID=1790 RepID=UPI0009BD0ECE|nr:ATP-binding protein [Mycobacterium asiaticum]
MTDNPVFIAPDSSGKTPRGAANTSDGTHADIIQIDTALESMRDSGFDLTAAAGEPIDNSIEADASLIRVQTAYGEGKRAINEIAFADNGMGISPNIMARSLSMGFSSRYGQRAGLGRFGVGMKLAGLSLGRRIDVFTKRRDSEDIWHAYIDLNEIRDGKQTHIESRVVTAWPEDHAQLMAGSDGQPFESGTLVVFGKIDRLTSGGHYGTALDEKLSELRTFIARTYRFFLDKGLHIELDGKPVTLLDPLFRLDNPRIIKRYKPADVRGVVIDEGEIEIANKQSIYVTVTLAPPEFRHRSGDGGNTDHLGRDIREFQIAESAGKISMVRNGREINYDIVPRLLPAGIDKVDRYIGIEVKFPAELDEFFQVRNVKRGAVPVRKLREELRGWLERPVRQARREIREHWGEVETRERANTDSYEKVTDAVAHVEKTSPRGQAGRDVSDEETTRIIDEILEDLKVAGSEDQESIDSVRKRLDEKPINLVDAQWPGSDLFRIRHLNGRAIVEINHRHPVWRDVFDPLKKVADDGGAGSTEQELVALIRKASAAIEVLVLAYAKAENLHVDPDTQFEQLRTYWGTFAKAYLGEVIKKD